MEKDKISEIRKNANKILEEALAEAKEHKNENSANQLTEVITGKGYNSDKVKKEPILVPEKTIDPEIEEDYIDDEVDDFSDIPYDLVPLPSKGLIYKGVKGKLQVAYLTASDEDLITSPNLYLDNKIIDYILRRKILDRNIKPENLCKGDRDAIVVWLRATGYGEKFPVSVKDPISGEKFDTEIDLSTLKLKEFNLAPDKDGYFEFTLPKTKDVVKFKFMCYKDEVGYTKLLERTNNKLKKVSLTNHLSTFKDIIENDKNIKGNFKIESDKYLTSLSTYIDSIDDKGEKGYLKNVTYLLEKSIVSINGNDDKAYIKRYVNMMPAFDSLKLRGYISVNTPGVDFKVTVERPESLGGGSFETFLELDSTIFLNLS
jgi:hypothetical protein